MTNSSRNTVVVCGATGKQGGVVVDQLLGDPSWRVVALARNPESTAAGRLRERGVEVRRGDFTDTASLSSAFADAYGVYGVTTPMSDQGKLDTDMERRQGEAIADASKEAGVQHLVMSTVLDMGDSETSPVAYLRSKRHVEEYVRDLGVPHTFVQPASFMDEIGTEFLPVKKGKITGQADNGAKVPYVACRDIGRLVKVAFDSPDRFVGQSITAIGDFLSGNELAQVLTQVDGSRRYRHSVPPVFLMRIFAREWITLRRQFEDWGTPPHPEPMLAGMEQTRELLPDAHTFESFLQERGIDPRWQ